MTGPRLLEARLIGRNRAARSRLVLSAAASIAALGLMLALRYQAAVAVAVNWLQQNVLMSGIALAFFMAILLARHRTNSRADFATSWLAALPFRRPAARLEALRLELKPAAWVAAASTVLLVLTEVALIPNHEGAKRAALIVWLWLMLATLVAVAASYAFREPRIIAPPPDSRYVPKPQSKRGRPMRPSLSALGLWPVRRMFSRAHPQFVARALVPVLLSMGLGTTADTAMVVIGLFVLMGALALLVPSVIDVCVAALRWMSPLPAPPSRLLPVLLSRSFAVILADSALAGFLLTLMNASNGSAAKTAGLLSMGSASVILLGLAIRGAGRT